MRKKMIFHAICAIVGVFIYYLFFDEVLLIDIIVFVSVYLLFSLAIELVVNKARSNRNKTQGTVVDHAEVELFIEAIGGIENIITTDFEASRVKIEVSDVNLIDTNRLKEFALDGAYLAGNQLQIAIGPNSREFSQQIRGVIE